MIKKIDELVDHITRKTVHKSKEAVVKEIRETVDEMTSGDNGKKLLITACLLSVTALVFSVIFRNSKPVIVNVYNGTVLS